MVSIAPVLTRISSVPSALTPKLAPVDSPKLVAGLGRLDDVAGSFWLLLRAHKHLTAIDDHVNVGLLSIVIAGIIAHGNNAIRTNNQG